MDLLVASSTGQLIVWSVVAFILYNVSLAIYRLVFHPLAKFPGPILARASYAYMFYHDIVRHGRFFVHHIKELHEEYGPIVRVSPDEVHVCDIDFTWETRLKKLNKPPGWNVQIDRSTVSAASHERHKMLRSAINPFFSKRNILANERNIKADLSRFFTRLRDCHKNDEVFRMDVAAMALTMDVICKFAFGIEFGHLDHPDFNLAWKNAFVGALSSISTLAMFPWLHKVMRLMPQSWSKRLNPRMAPMLEWENTIANLVDQFMAGNAAGKRKDGTIFQAILDSDLPSDEKDADRLRQEGSLVVGAGSETTARALAVNSFFIFRDRIRLQKLRDEIKTVPRDDDGFYKLIDLEKLPYLSACIEEGLRLQVSSGSRRQRQYTKPLSVQGYTIPPLYTWSDSHHDRILNPRIFLQPDEYIPERWIDGERYNLQSQQKYFTPFERGTWNCVGQNLAMAEIYITIAHLVMKFDLELYDTTYERDIRVEREIFVGAPSLESKGIHMKVTKVLEA